MRRQLLVIIVLALAVAAGIVLVRRSAADEPKAVALPAATGGDGRQEAAYSAVLDAVRAGQISVARVRQSLLRVLVAKGGYSLIVSKPQSSG